MIRDKKKTKSKKNRRAPPRRAKLLANRSTEELSIWLLLGFRRWACPASGQSALNAFYPLQLTSKDIAYQLEDAGRDDAAFNAQLHTALDLAFARWDNTWTIEALGLSFGLAARIGSASVQGHALRLIRNAQVFDAPADQRGKVVAQMVNALAGAEWDSRSDEFVRELHLRNMWWPDFAAPVTLGRIKADPDRWLDITLAAASDLERSNIYGPATLALIMEKIVRTASLTRVVHDLPRAWGVNDWLVRAMLTHDDPVLRIPDRETVQCEELTAFWDYRALSSVAFAHEDTGVWKRVLDFYAKIKDALTVGASNMLDEPLFAEIAKAQELYWSCSTPDDRKDAIREAKAQAAQVSRWGKGPIEKPAEAGVSLPDQALVRRGRIEGFDPARQHELVDPFAKRFITPYALVIKDRAQDKKAATPAEPPQ